MLLKSMALTSQQFEMMASDMRSERKGGVDRRRHARAGVRVRLEVLPVVNGVAGRPFAVFTRDLSKSGMSFLSDARFEAGSHVVWELPDADGGAPKRWGGVVRSCRRTAGEQWTVGVEFLKEPPAITSRAKSEPPASKPVTKAGKAKGSPAPPTELPASEITRIRQAILD